MAAADYVIFIHTLRCIPEQQDTFVQLNIDIVEKVARKSPGFDLASASFGPPKRSRTTPGAQPGPRGTNGDRISRPAGQAPWKNPRTDQL